MILYNAIGEGYNYTRQADPRIVDKLIKSLDLPPGKKIADVGAGTGNYSNAIADRGYQVVAIEPSEKMQSQAKAHQQVEWITAAAENIPLADNLVDGAVVMLALHHFKNIDLGLREINRIVKNPVTKTDRSTTDNTVTGKIVIFAFEQSKIPDFWLTDYFPYFIRDTLATVPSTQTIASKIQQITQKPVTVTPFLLPPDLKDLFAAGGWCKPEIYLEEKVRRGISSFAKMEREELESGTQRLQNDLDKGIWQQKYGYLQQQSEYDAGYRLIIG